MDIEKIAFNINKMLEYRLNSSNQNFNILFKEYEKKASKQKLKYDIKLENNNIYIIKYYNENDDKNLHKIVYVNIDINQIKTLLDEENTIILYNISLTRKINQIINTNQYNCEFFETSIFYINYKENIYFVNCCKSKETNINDKIQHISYQDYNVLYLGLKPGEYIFINNIIDSSLSIPQIRIVKK